MTTALVTPPFDAARAEAFAARMTTAYNETAISLMTSIGHRTGLFDAMAGLAPSTSQEIADHADLDERYVREWLGAMVTGGVVEYEAARARYRLPSEHAACLTRAASPDNLAVMSQYFPVIAGVEDDVVRCFREGGGVPYERFPRFHEVMAEESAQSVGGALEGRVLPLLPELVAGLERGIRMLDVGCGSGRILNRLAARFPRSRFVGYDLSTEATGRGRAEAAERGLANVDFFARDVSDFDVTAEPRVFDLVATFDAVHDQKRPLAVLRGIRRTLRADGVYLMQDIGLSSHLERDREHPLAPLVYTISCLHCMTVSLAQGGDGVGAAWGEERTREYLAKAGFRSIETHKFEEDPLNHWYVVRE